MIIKQGSQNDGAPFFLKVLIQDADSNVGAGGSSNNLKMFQLKDLGISVDKISPKIEEYLLLFKQLKESGNISDTWVNPTLSLDNLFDEAFELKKELLRMIITDMSLTSIVNLGNPIYVFVSQNENDTHNKAEKYLKLGEEEREKGNYDKAIENFFKAFEINMNYYGVTQNMGFNCYQLGKAFASKGDHDIAIAFFQKALQIDIDTLDADNNAIASDYNELGAIYQKKEDYAKAIEYHKKALKIDLKKFSGSEQNYDKAATYHQAGNHGEAIKYFQAGIVPNTKYYLNIIVDHQNIGTAYGKLGDKKKAAIYLEKARSKSLSIFGPDNKLTKAIQKQFDWVLNKGE